MKPIILYLFGFGSAILIALIMDAIIPDDNANLIFSRWEISEENPDNLLINLLDYDNVPVIIDIKRDPEKGSLEEVGFFKVVGGEQHGYAFKYEVKGKYGIPMAEYGSPGGGRGMVWHDLNFDSQFDQRFDFQKRWNEINVEGSWLRASGRREVVTEKGIFAFDVQSGKWLPVDPNSSTP